MVSKEEQRLLHQCKHLLLSLYGTHTYVVNYLNCTPEYAHMQDRKYYLNPVQLLELGQIFFFQLGRWK